MILNSSLSDPTRLTTLRRVFFTETRKRMRSLLKSVTRYVEQQLNWHHSEESFIEELSRFIDIECRSCLTYTKWYDRYVIEAYRKGAERAFKDVGVRDYKERNVNAPKWFVDRMLNKNQQLTLNFDPSQRRAPKGTEHGGEWIKSSFTDEEVKRGLEALDKLPDAEEGYQTFEIPDSQIKLRDVGISGGMGIMFGGKRESDPYAEMLITDLSVLRYTQSSVIREAVRKKLTEDYASEFGRGDDFLPSAVKSGSLIHIQTGHHRAAAQILATGQLRLKVTESIEGKRGKRQYKLPVINFDPNQPRAPKGAETGGQWVSSRTVYHSTDKESAKILEEEGIDDDMLNRRDSGFFGRGFYTSQEPQDLYGKSLVAIKIKKDAKVLSVGELKPSKPQPWHTEFIESLKRRILKHRPDFSPERMLTEISAVTPGSPSFSHIEYAQEVGNFARSEGYQVVKFAEGQETVILDKSVVESIIHIGGIKSAHKHKRGLTDNQLTENASPRSLSSRVGQEFKGLSDYTSNRILRKITDGVSAGTSKTKLVEEITGIVKSVTRSRARAIVETELTRIHAEAYLDTLEELGIQRVGVAVEWDTRNDGKVCSLCRKLDGLVLTVKEARGLLPRHVNCRCSFAAIKVGRYTKGQIRSQTQIKRAIDSSITEEKPGVSLRQAKKQSTWQGKNTRISKNRPKDTLKTAREKSKAKAVTKSRLKAKAKLKKSRQVKSNPRKQAKIKARTK